MFSEASYIRNYTGKEREKRGMGRGRLLCWNAFCSAQHFVSPTGLEEAVQHAAAVCLQGGLQTKMDDGGTK